MSEHSIGKTIASLRKSKGWTQVELAEKLNVSDKAVSKWESEAGFPEISQLPAMANLFGVTIDYLMTGKTAEKEIIINSKAKLHAKTEVVSFADKVKDLPDDEYNKQVQSIIRNGIINIKKLKEIATFATIKRALYEYPIHPFELLYQMYQQQKWRELFEFSVDFTINGLSDSIMKQNKTGIETAILETWTKDNQPNDIRILCINNDEMYASRSEILCSRRDNHKQKTIQEVVDYLSAVRQRIIEELAIKFDKDRITGELTKEYFDSELSKGNKELVIIKLCVRMEAILKCDYNYQGDFSEMLDSFCNQFETYDDENNNYDPYTPALLNRLRRQRNSIVHAEKQGEPMSDEEIKQCIDYICSL
mgnify:FL=1